MYSTDEYSHDRGVVYVLLHLEAPECRLKQAQGCSEHTGQRLQTLAQSGNRLPGRPLLAHQGWPRIIIILMIIVIYS